MTWFGRWPVYVVCLTPVLACSPLGAQIAATDAGPLTVERINRNPTGSRPNGPVWSPDGRTLTYVAGGEDDERRVGRPGDLLAVDAATGTTRVLASAARMDALGAAAVNEKDRDHRDRYGMAGYFWASDSKHLLLDKGGMLWLFDPAAGTGSLVVDTHAGSGDDPKFSPDGRWISYLREHDLYVYPAGTSGGKGAEVALTRGGGAAMLHGELDWVYLEELDARSNYFWSPDSTAVAYLEMDERKVPQYPIEDFIPTHATLDEQRFPQPGDANPGVRVGVASVKGGETTWMQVPLRMGNDYIPRFGWVDAQTLYVEVLTRDQKTMNLYFADAHTGVLRMVQQETDAKYLDESYDVTMLPHGRFLQASWRDGHMHLYLYAFDEKHPLAGEARLERQITKGEFEVQSVNGVFGETVFYTSTEGSPLEDHLWSIGLDGTGKRRLTKEAGVHDPLVSPDGAHFADLWSTRQTPAVATLCGVADLRCETFWRSKPLGAVDGVTSGIVTFVAADGVTKLYGTLTQPAGTQRAGSVPIILNPYGGPTNASGVKDAWGGQRALFDALLAQHGFAVLTVDNRGSGGRGRDFQQADYHDFGAVQFADQMAALDQTLKANPQLDARRVGWWGWSWGGTFTLYAMTHTDRIRAGVAVAPVTDFRNYDSIYTERYLGLPEENPEVYRKASVTASAGNLKGRVLIAQGTGDDNVHMANTMQMLEPLIAAGIPYDLQMFPRLTHSIAGVSARDELFKRILWQFETYLKPMPATP